MMWRSLYSFFHAASIYWKTNSESGSTAASPSSAASPLPPTPSVLHRWIGAFCACVIPPPVEEEGSRLVWVESCTTTTCAPAHCMASTPKDRPADRTARKKEIKGAGREIANNHLRQFQCQERNEKGGKKERGLQFQVNVGGRQEGIGDGWDRTSQVPKCTKCMLVWIWQRQLSLEFHMHHERTKLGSFVAILADPSVRNSSMDSQNSVQMFLFARRGRGGDAGRSAVARTSFPALAGE